MAFTQLPFHPMTSEVEAQTLNSPAFDVGGMTELDVALQINAVKSACSFDVSVEHSMDMKDWYALGTVLAGASSSGEDTVESFTSFMRYVRAVTTLKGSGCTATYSVLGIAKDSG